MFPGVVALGGVWVDLGVMCSRFDGAFPQRRGNTKEKDKEHSNDEKKRWR
jgi:hypothetical protein